MGQSHKQAYKQDGRRRQSPSLQQTTNLCGIRKASMRGSVVDVRDHGNQASAFSVIVVVSVVT